MDPADGQLVLLTRPPDYEVRLSAKRVDDDGAIVVELEDLPEWPDWQTGDLVPAIYGPPWLAPTDRAWYPLSGQERNQTFEVALTMAHRVVDRLREIPQAYKQLRASLSEIWVGVVIGSGGHTRAGRALNDVDRVMLASMAVFEISMLVRPEKCLQTSAPQVARLDKSVHLVDQLRRNRHQIRADIRSCLSRVGVPPHLWAEVLVFGLLVHPYGMAWILSPFLLGVASTPLERGIEFALGTPDSVYRTANKFHRAFLAAHGYRRERDHPGPKPGKPRPQSKDRLRFENYVWERWQAGVSAQFIAQDAEAQRLYRRTRKDQQAALSEQTVRRVIRKAPQGPNLP